MYGVHQKLERARWGPVYTLENGGMPYDYKHCNLTFLPVAVFLRLFVVELSANIRQTDDIMTLTFELLISK